MNGLEALLHDPKFPQNRRLILLDLNIPKLGGIEFLRELRVDIDWTLSELLEWAKVGGKANSIALIFSL